MRHCVTVSELDIAHAKAVSARRTELNTGLRDWASTSDVSLLRFSQLSTVSSLLFLEALLKEYLV